LATLLIVLPSLRLGALLLAAALVVTGCAIDAAAPAFDPSGPCTVDGKAPGAYPDLEAMVPKRYHGAAPDTVDSGRNCTTSNLGSLASAGIREIRFAGGTWTFGAERALVLAVFRADELDAEEVASFYAQTASAASRTTITGQTTPAVAGRPGHRLDTMTGERTQTVVTWPSSKPNVVNVIISNDLPDARIQEAIDAFGGN
jgi:hypothetical protein